MSAIEAQLGEVVASAISALEKSGVPRPEAEDVAQEAAARLLSLCRADTPPSFTSRWALQRWCFGVAKNARIDAWRRDRRLVFGEVPEHRGLTNEVEDRARARIAEREMLAAFKYLTPREHAAISAVIEGLGDDEPVELDPAERSRRYDARRRLRRAIRNYPGILPLPRIARWLGRAETLPPVWAAAAVAVVVPSLWAGGAQTQPRVRVALGHTSRVAALSVPPGAPPTNESVRPLHSVQGKRSASAPSDRSSGDESTLAEVDQPTGNSSTLRLKPNSNDKPLVCFETEVARLRLCVAKPKGGAP